MDAVFYSVHLAVSALSGDRVDVSRRLCARRDSDAAGRRARWSVDFAPDHSLCDNADPDQSVACGVWNVRADLPGWCGVAWFLVSVYGRAGGVRPDECSGAACAAGFGDLSADDLRFDGSGSALTLNALLTAWLSRSGWLRKSRSACARRCSRVSAHGSKRKC